MIPDGSFHGWLHHNSFSSMFSLFPCMTTLISPNYDCKESFFMYTIIIYTIFMWSHENPYNTKCIEVMYSMYVCQKLRTKTVQCLYAFKSISGMCLCRIHYLNGKTSIWGKNWHYFKILFYHGGCWSFIFTSLWITIFDMTLLHFIHAELVS